MVSVEELFDDYCFYRAHTANIQQIKADRPYMRDPKLTLQKSKLLDQLIKWCTDQGVNPKEWMYTLFVTRRWMYAPKFDAGHLLSEKHLPKHKRVTDYAFYRQRCSEQEEIDHKVDDQVFDPNRDLSGTAEQIKNSYLKRNMAEYCFQAIDETFGYHPKSRICAKCPIKMRCKAHMVRSMPFDVMALRRGEITSQQARQQALARAQSRG